MLFFLNTRKKELVHETEEINQWIQKQERMYESVRLVCPMCHNHVVFIPKEKELIPVSDNPESNSAVVPQEMMIEQKKMELSSLNGIISIIDSKIKIISEQSAILNSKIPESDPEPPDPLILQKKLHTSQKQRLEYDTLQSNKTGLPSSLRKRETMLNLMVKKLGENISPSITKEEVQLLEQEITQLTTELEDDSRNKSDHASYKREIDSHQKTIGLLMKTISKQTTGGAGPLWGTTVSQLEQESSALLQTIMTYTENLTVLREELDQTLEYEKTEEQRLKIQKLIQSKTEKSQELKALETKLEGYYGLESTGKEAEMLSVEETVKIINEHARIYLEQMFPENPIIVRLETLKNSGKTVKFQMGVTIEYKGNLYTSVDELSGGERQKCELAYMLAVNDILGSQILMLDECLNNIDPYFHSDVLTYLKDMCSNKLVLVISQEAIRGVFDYDIVVGDD
jgi:ABC-type polar amino acid transport system ATPase subunit